MARRIAYVGEIFRAPGVKSVRSLGGNWVEGRVDGHKFQAKVFEEPSHYGIDGGRVSKLAIVGKKGQYAAVGVLYNYDRGEDVATKLGVSLKDRVLQAFR